MYRDGKRLSDNELRLATGVVACVRVHSTWVVNHMVTDATMDACPNPYPRLVEPRLTGIAQLALGIEGFEVIERNGETVYKRQCWLCREPKR